MKQTTSFSKKAFILFIGIFATGFVVNAQSDKINAKDFYHTPYNQRTTGSFENGKNILSLGYGVPNWLYDGYGVDNSYVYGGGYSHIGIGPLMVKYERGIRDEVGVGIIMQGAMKSWKYGSYVDRAYGTGFALMGYYHFNKLIPVKKLDVYAGLGIGFTYEHYTVDASYYDYYHSKYGNNYYYTGPGNTFEVRPNVVVGARYYVKPKFGFFVEAGYTTLSSMNLGVSFAF